MLKHLTIVALLSLFLAASASAQTSRPATRAARAGRAPVPVVLTPRDSGPWTPGDFKTAKAELPSLIIAGDSTAAQGDPNHRGWAAVLNDYFDQTRVNLINRSRGGRSARSFLHEGLWDEMMQSVKAGDYVFIQFGHNDGGAITNPNGRADLPGNGEESKPTTRPDGTTEIVHTFGWYNRKFIADVKAKGAIPILMSSTVYNRWANGKFTHRPGDFQPVLDQVAVAEKVPLLDHTAIITQRYDALGQEAVSQFFKADFLHTTTSGAVVNAECFVAGLKQMDIKPLVDALNEKGKAIAAYVPSAAAK